MLKAKRQKKLLSLIATRKIASQEELTHLLEKEGFFVNQSSVSRDLVELGIVKVSGAYAVPQRQDGNRYGLLSLDSVGENLIVAKTEAGIASAVCVRIDREEFGEVAGTIAGEDTIFIATKDKKSQKSAIRKIWELFES
jgi:transcriptional regulator of arginine metabolism